MYDRFGLNEAVVDPSFIPSNDSVHERRETRSWIELSSIQAR